MMLAQVVDDDNSGPASSLLRNRGTLSYVFFGCPETGETTAELRTGPQVINYAAFQRKRQRGLSYD
jgi:hypothetical protein